MHFNLLHYIYTSKTFTIHDIIQPIHRDVRTAFAIVFFSFAFYIFIDGVNCFPLLHSFLQDFRIGHHESLVFRLLQHVRLKFCDGVCTEFQGHGLSSTSIDLYKC